MPAKRSLSAPKVVLLYAWWPILNGIKRRRPKIYDQEVLKDLRKIWHILDHPCSLRLKAMLPKMVPKLEKHGELELKPEVRKKLFKISRSTIDRLLAPERKHLHLKSRAKTKPGSLLKRQIPIRTHAGWKENVNRPGFFGGLFL